MSDASEREQMLHAATQKLGSPPAEADPHDLLQPGEVVDSSFAVKHKIGSGGMGQVYEAQDLRLGRAVALKVAWPRVGGGMALEAKILAQLRHEGIMHIHHMGIHRGLDYLVMELLLGQTLEQRLASVGRLPVAECLELLERISGALENIHQHGLVHRDLKPANVMVLPGGRVVLVDFGITAHERDAGDHERASGSPHYMAPEVFSGAILPGEAHLADIYALGVVAFELLSGKVPFEGGSPVELANQHLDVQPPRASTFRDDVPPRLDHLVAAMLAKAPSERPPSISTVLAQLQAARRSLDRAPNREPSSVLIVDDDAAMLALLRACVHQAAPSASLQVSTNGVEAMRRLQNEQFDLILIDLEIPDVNGVEICMYVSTLPVPPRVAIISSHDDAENRNALRRLGAEAFVSKRNGLLELEDAISDLVQRAAPAASRSKQR